MPEGPAERGAGAMGARPCERSSRGEHLTAPERSGGIEPVMAGWHAAAYWGAFSKSVRVR
jgi:hypothetical protein